MSYLCQTLILLTDSNVARSSFLPQDRVAHFSRMSSPEYLKETQKAAGAARLTEWHNTLIAERKTEVELEDVRLTIPLLS